MYISVSGFLVLVKMNISTAHYNHHNLAYLLLVVIILVQSVDVLRRDSTSGIKKDKESKWSLFI